MKHYLQNCSCLVRLKCLKISYYDFQLKVHYQKGKCTFVIQENSTVKMTKAGSRYSHLWQLAWLRIQKPWRQKWPFWFLVVWLRRGSKDSVIFGYEASKKSYIIYRVQQG